MCQTLPGAEIMIVNKNEMISDPTRVYQVGEKHYTNAIKCVITCFEKCCEGEKQLTERLRRGVNLQGTGFQRGHF